MRTTVRWVDRDELEHIVLGVLRRVPGCAGVKYVRIEKTRGPAGHWSFGHLDCGNAKPTDVDFALQQIEPHLLARYLLVD